MLVAAPVRRAAAETAIGQAGGRLIATFDWHETAALMNQSLGRPVLALEAEGVDERLLARGLADVYEIARAIDLIVVVTHRRAQIDTVAGALLGLQVQFLCDVDMAEWVGTLAIAGRQSAAVPMGLREGDRDRLTQLNDEVARIAELLARLAGRDRGGGGGGDDDGVGDRHVSFGYEPPAETADPRLVRQAIRARRMRDAFLGENLFEDPAWDMLLDLYAAHLEGQRVSVSSLCIAAAVAPTTALRWIGRLTESGLFERHPDPADRRRAFMTLSPRALKGMNGYVAAMRRAGLPIG